MNSPKPSPRSRFPVDRIFKPFSQVIIPLTPDYTPLESLKMAHELREPLASLVLSAFPPAKRFLRQPVRCAAFAGSCVCLPGSTTLLVTCKFRAAHNVWGELRELTRTEPSILLILEWPGLFARLGIASVQEVCNFSCHVAILKGTWNEQPPSILVPIRGGPNSELALRFCLAPPRRSLSVLHIPRTSNVPPRTKLPCASASIALPAASLELTQGLARSQ